MTNADTNKHGESEGFPIWVYQLSVMGGAVAGILALSVYGFLSPDADGWQIAALSFLIGVAAFMVSGLLGYLFGIPVATAESPVPFESNTSLEQISEWLTKIVIGLGLVEFRSLVSWLDSIGEAVASTTNLAGAKQAFIALILLESVAGFIFFYLWSRVHMPRLFLSGEVKAAIQVREREEIEKDIEESRRARRTAAGAA